MSFTCDKCGFVFDREKHLERHIGNKIPCNRDLTCSSCSKEFNRMGDLKRHMNRKNPCAGAGTLNLMLQIEQERTKQEIEKTKQAKFAQINNITNNISGDQIININNFDQAKFIQPESQYEAQRLIKSGNVEETLGRIAMSQYGGDQKYIIIDGQKIFIKIKDEIVEFKHGRPLFNSRIKEACEHILYEYGKYSEDEMYKYECDQRDTHIPDDENTTVKRTSQFVGNNRNNGYVDKVLINTFNE